ncbi:MAG: hypothetical protein JXR88_08040 [Clostridia bacterium]|nr:hypothetical protein [Clostridia bacterium]
MIKKILLLILLITLTSCAQNKSMDNKDYDQKVTTPSDVIRDGQVKIDEISYDIDEISIMEYIYDENGNILKQLRTSDKGTSTIEYVYVNNVLMEDIKYVNNTLPSSTYYYYENGKLVETRYERNGVELITKYYYVDNIKTIIGLDQEGKALHTIKAYFNESGNIVSSSTVNEHGKVIDSKTYYYENNLLVKVINEEEDVFKSIINYEYNNLGNKIMEYGINYGEADNLFIILYDYEYYSNMLPKKVTSYLVRTLLTK